MKEYAFGFLLNFAEDWAKDLLVILTGCCDILKRESCDSSKLQH